MCNDYFKLLENGEIERCKREESNHQQIAFTKLPNGTRISTIFTGVNATAHIDGGGRSIFETMVFGGENNHYFEYASTKKQALEDHERIKTKLLKGEKLEEDDED